METEKVDKCNGFGTTDGDYVYPTRMESIGCGGVNTSYVIERPGSATPALRPQTFAEIHASRVIDELWKMYEEEDDFETKFDLLRAISNTVNVLHRVKGE